MLNTILFDLNGTLCPVTRTDFMSASFAALVHALSPMGYDGEKLTDALKKGVEAIVCSDGKFTNRQVFWESLTQTLGVTALTLEALLLDFYQGDFDTVRTVQRRKLDCGPLLRGLREKGYTLILASDPVLPAEAVEAQLGWIGLKGQSFDLMTTYENSRHCKPDLDYYREILSAISRSPADCLMVGNDPIDDMAAVRAGLSGYLVTDYLENPERADSSAYRTGSLEEAAAYLEALPSLSR